MKENILLISSSFVHGSGYLEHMKGTLKSFLDGIEKITFVPFAKEKSEWDSYTEQVQTFFASLNIQVIGLHRADRIPYGEKAIFVGGGNTFRLLTNLQQGDYFGMIQELVASGTKYIGSSAGTNIAGPTIMTTNDMPIMVPPQGFRALSLVPFQINPHYQDPDPKSTHKGETREQRLNEFHQENWTPIIALREGTSLLVRKESSQVTLIGKGGARIFRRGEAVQEVSAGRIEWSTVQAL